jgi:2-amino-4-hydroxy-6-hydroxymethyldihydropteridine diphosphokinase
MEENTAYIGMGSNLGNRKEYIDKALQMLAEAEHIKISQVSDLIETTPLGHFRQPKFVNGIAEIKTTWSVEGLYEKLIEIETFYCSARRS